MSPDALTVADVQALGGFWPMPVEPRPIVVIGAGSIVNDGHLPAYRKNGLPVAGIVDVDGARARATAERFDVGTVYASLDEALATPDAVFDVAVPPESTAEIVGKLPRGSTALLQKPMGTSLVDAQTIVARCTERALVAAVNLQLRFAPMMLAVRHAIEAGMIGAIVDLEIHLVVRQPWENWPFMSALAHVEVPMHSIHYLDWIRSVLGEPSGVYSRSVGHREHPELADARTTTILDYGDELRCALSLNHTYRHGPRFRDATVMVEGTRGAARVTLGSMLDYPTGEPERVHVCTEGVEWTEVPLPGSWFPDGFAGVMANLQRFSAGEDDTLETSVHSALQTMAVVDACARSDATRGVAPRADTVSS